MPWSDGTVWPNQWQMCAQPCSRLPLCLCYCSSVVLCCLCGAGRGCLIPAVRWDAHGQLLVQEHGVSPVCAELCSTQPAGLGMRGNSPMLCQGRGRLDIRTDFFSKREVVMHRMPRGVVGHCPWRCSELWGWAWWRGLG